MSTQLVLKADHLTQGYLFAVDANGRPQVLAVTTIADGFVDAINQAHGVRLAAAEWRAAVLRHVLHLTATPETLAILALLKTHGIDIVEPQLDTAPRPRNGETQ